MRDNEVMNASTRRTLLIVAALALVLVLVIVAVSVLSAPKATPSPTPSPTATATMSPAPGATVGVTLSPAASASSPGVVSGFLVVSPDLLAKARADLARIAIGDDLAQAGYSRAQFGPAWTDGCTTSGCGNGCDTRNDILARDLSEIVLKSQGCAVLSGTLHDPYTGKVIAFVRGVSTSNAVQIDHIVPLGEAWRTGAQTLPFALRVNLANDPLNLVAVDGPTNGAKSDDDAAQWLPPQTNARCAYVVHQIEVKFTYQLWMSGPEHDAIANVLAGCE